MKFGSIKGLILRAGRGWQEKKLARKEVYILAQACGVLMHKLSADKKGGRHCMSRFFLRGYLRNGRSGIQKIFSRIVLRHLVSVKKTTKFKSGLFSI